MLKPKNPKTQKPKNQCVVFFGNGSYILPILKVLHEKFNLVLVLTTEKSKDEPVLKYSKIHNINYKSIEKFNEHLAPYILNLKSPVGVLANFGLIIPKKVLTIFPKGIINIHPSLLPKYRGPTPGQTAILNGDRTTGVTIIKLDEKVDHGPILIQIEEQILENDTAESLYKRLFKIGANLIEENLEKYFKGKVELKEQEHSKATFTKPLTRKEGFIDLSSFKIENLKFEIGRKIRAYYPWPGVWTKWKVESGKWKILKLLPNQKIQIEGKKPMTYKDFINGYQKGKEIIDKISI